MRLLEVQSSVRAEKSISRTGRNKQVVKVLSSRVQRCIIVMDKMPYQPLMIEPLP